MLILWKQDMDFLPLMADSDKKYFSKVYDLEFKPLFTRKAGISSFTTGAGY